MAAAVIGFIGNETVAITASAWASAIGSAALVADGQHARIDGLTSLAVLVGALGVLGRLPAGRPARSAWSSRWPSSSCCATPLARSGGG